MSSGQLRNLARTGKLKPTDLVRRGGTGEWKEASSVAGLLAQSDSVPSPRAPESTTPTGPTAANAVAQSAANNKILLWGAGGCGGSFMLFFLICCGLAGIKNAQQAARRAEERVSTNSGLPHRNVNNSNESTANHSPSISSKPVNIGTLEEMGDRAFKNLPFANVEQGTGIPAVPLSESFAKSGTFTFRRIMPDMLKAQKSPQKWEQLKVLGYKERTEIQEVTKTFNIRPSEGEPRSMIEWKTWPGLPHAYPIIRMGAISGDRWEWINHDVSGNEMLSRYEYSKCVEYAGVKCVMIESELFIGGQKSGRKFSWYAEEIGLVKETDFTILPDYTLESTYHRIVKD
ncbi:hypothetical protein Pla8534_18390 [Lignipirellula cremea]|uniref:GYF domain-containing protein n=2 Tax=Lignipirellula cremea TaxID=2528010 RepID=A0A518DQD2_9BACT|nr:hypothetical protein Pla8534_18390 [Lignipirellula cremea]